MSYSVVYWNRQREMSCAAPSWSRAMDRAAKLATERERPFPIIIKDDAGHIVHTIKG